jgi:MSHA biogenesis protein MshO
MKIRFLRQRGVTLVELIIVMVLIGAIGGIIALQLKPTLEGYLAVGKRAGLTDQADSALRRIVTEVRSAVPNSLRLGNARCLELVPSSDGGRYRAGPDVDPDHEGEAFLDFDVPASEFDVLTTFMATPAPGDLIVIGNQNNADVYQNIKGPNVRTIGTVAVPPAPWMGEHRITLLAPQQVTIPNGYTGGRFVVVPGGQAVSYICSEGRDESGTGTGKLVRLVRPIAPGQVCEGVPDDAPVLASKVEHCEITYSPNQGATQQSGFMQMRLTLTDGGESVSLTIGAHVNNMP